MARPDAPDVPTAFRGFGDEALQFYEGLEADNSKTYWTRHQELYEREVRDPLTALAAALEPEFGPMKLFRPYRDVRFSKDKTPYKTQAGAVSRGEDADGTFYVQISAAGLMIAGGYYRMAKDQTARYRAAVDHETTGAGLAGIVAGLERDGWAMHGEELKRAPRGFDPEHPRVGLLRRKSLAAFLELGTPRWLGTARARQRVAEGFRRVQPLNAWLATHVGPAEAVEGDRTERLRR